MWVWLEPWREPPFLGSRRVSDSLRNRAWRWARDIAGVGGRGDSEFVRLSAETLARSWSHRGSQPRWLAEYARAELYSLGHVGTRVFLRYSPDAREEPLFYLFQLACRISPRSQMDVQKFHESEWRVPSLEPLWSGSQMDAQRFHESEWLVSSLDPLWPALARYVAGHPSQRDLALLEELARHPERREGVLRWGLQYFVRGDIVLDDGTVVTLDELCDELQLPRLPYVTDIPRTSSVDVGKLR